MSIVIKQMGRLIEIQDNLFGKWVVFSLVNKVRHVMVSTGTMTAERITIKMRGSSLPETQDLRYVKVSEKSVSPKAHEFMVPYGRNQRRASLSQVVISCFISQKPSPIPLLFSSQWLSKPLSCHWTRSYSITVPDRSTIIQFPSAPHLTWTKRIALLPLTWSLFSFFVCLCLFLSMWLFEQQIAPLMPYSKTHDSNDDMSNW